MSTLWTLREQGVRWIYHQHIRTFFFVEKDFYNNNKEDLEQFCIDTGSDLKNGWIECSTDEDVLLFMLKWA